MGFPIFDPTVAPRGEGFTPAPRPARLAGKVVGLLDNGKPGSDRLLEHLAGLLRSAHGAGEVIRQRKPSPYRPAPAEQIADLGKRADLVVTGVGD